MGLAFFKKRSIVQFLKFCVSTYPLMVEIMTKFQLPTIFAVSVIVSYKCQSVCTLLQESAKMIEPSFTNVLGYYYFVNEINYLIMFKGTVMQIEKALINVRLRVSNKKFHITTICNFAVIYPWNLLFS